MSVARGVGTLYWSAIGLFVVGVALRFVGGALDADPMSTVGEILNALAWPLAAVAAVIDVARRQRHEDVLEHADADGGRRLRS